MTGDKQPSILGNRLLTQETTYLAEVAHSSKAKVSWVSQMKAEVRLERRHAVSYSDRPAVPVLVLLMVVAVALNPNGDLSHLSLFLWLGGSFWVLAVQRLQMSIFTASN